MSLWQQDVDQLEYGALAVRWLRQFVTWLSPQRYEFDPRPVHVKFVGDKMKPGEVSDYFRLPFSGSSHPRCLDVTDFYSSDRMHSLRGTNLDRKNRWLRKHISPFTKRVQEFGYIALDEISRSNAITRRLPQRHLLTFAIPDLQNF